MEEKRGKVLLIRLSAMGDVIFNIPLANCLKDNGYEVHWLVSEKGYSLIKDNPCVDKVYLAPVEKWKKSGKLFQNFKEYLGILKTLRGEKFDIAIDTQLILKSLYWTRFCGARRRIVSKNAREGAILGGNEVIPSTRDGFNRHVVKCYLKFAEYLGLNTEKIKVTLPPTSIKTQEKINELLKPLNPAKKTIIIARASIWVPKHWNKDNWKAVVNGIKDKCSLVFTGTAGDKDLISYIGGDNFINLAGQTTIKDLIEIFSRAVLVMAPDSGSAHVARATEIPAVISIFCCTPPTSYGPFGNDKKYFALNGRLKCQPCHTRKCPLPGKDAEQCVNYPEPEEIINIVNNILQNSKHSV